MNKQRVLSRFERENVGVMELLGTLAAKIAEFQKAYDASRAPLGTKAEALALFSDAKTHLASAKRRRARHHLLRDIETAYLLLNDALDKLKLSPKTGSAT